MPEVHAHSKETWRLWKIELDNWLNLGHQSVGAATQGMLGDGSVRVELAKRTTFLQSAAALGMIIGSDRAVTGRKGLGHPQIRAIRA